MWAFLWIPYMRVSNSSGIGVPILTDYLEFCWYAQGKRHIIARIGSIRNKKLLLEKNGVKLRENLLHCFLEYHSEPVRKPQEGSRIII